ncbi:serine--tRNA ligase [candidate division KSB3 bacterium]|uniref:Serine--tRNA ligase n=1 Tax=candidate division KSB3 bacterium TaxID=2044937 RepID=A0A2G6KGC4_9BACT|nr:MAG: serine--tRNA ligase [candidate division KSB3 bacterium]
MLDIRLIKEKPEEIRQALLKRMDDVDFTEVLDLDTQRRALIQETEALKARRNTVSSQIPVLKKSGEPIDDLQREMQDVSARIKTLDAELSTIDASIKDFLIGLPNIPDEDVPAGGKENNRVVRTWGEQPRFDFPPRDHVELVTLLGLIDYERGVKMGGRGFWLYKGYGSLMEWGLLNYFVESHLKDGYEFILPPHLLNYQCGLAAGQFPKFEEDVFHLATDEDDEKFTQFLLPTAETALINFHRDEILQEEELPKKYFAYTPCYRKEAGSYRTQERGMIRGHQFNKVEMFQFTTPDQSDQALEELIAKAEKLVQGLGLHYQVSQLAAKDCSASMAKTFDIEVWIPSMNKYVEISSASNSRDYQPRRGNIRFKRKDAKKPEFIHALNASGLATSRLLPAIVEQYQQADSSVVVPEILRKWVGTDVLQPA